MPDGKTHAFATVITTGAVAGLLYFLGGDDGLSPALAYGLGGMTGLLVTPDLDIPTGSRSFTLVRRVGGSLIGWLWSRFWMPYARLIPRHRHPLSHWPLLGTALRLLYMFGIPSVIYWLVRNFWVLALSFSPLSGAPLPGLPPLKVVLGNPYVWLFFTGLAFSDALHALMDETWPRR